MRTGRHLVAIPEFIPENRLQVFQEEAEECLDTAQRVHIPQHKRGETISYQTLRNSAPQIVAFYQSGETSRALSERLRVRVMPTPMRDQSSCSILIYNQEGDHIGWHYDYNFYNGRHFTALLPLVNEAKGGADLSSSRLMTRTNGREQEIPTPPNTLVMFEGVHVCHRVTPLKEHERRVILSMTFCTDCGTTPLKDLERRIKDTAYFGLRALRT
jgi:hypothetical protein